MKAPYWDILACPICKGRLSYQHTTQELICKADRLIFPFTENQVPMMRVDRALLLSNRDMSE